MMFRLNRLLFFFPGVCLLAGIAAAQGMNTQPEVRNAVDRIEKEGDRFKDALKSALENVHLSAREKRAKELAEDLEDEVDNLKKHYKDGHYGEARENLDNALMMAASVDRFMQRSYFRPEVRATWGSLIADLNVIAVGNGIAPVVGANTQVVRSADRIQTGAVSGWSRGRMEREIRHELVMLPYYGVFDSLGFRVDGDTVTLTGQVTTPTLKTSAEQVVRDIEGVGRVVNAIEVLPPSPGDDRLRRAIYQAIYVNTPLNRYAMQAVPPIHIIVNGGRVTLDGVVANSGDRDIALMQARSVPGAFSVTNNLRVE